MTKKWITAVILIGLLTACGNKAASDTKTGEADNKQPAVSTEAKAPSTDSGSTNDKQGTSSDNKQETSFESKTLENDQFAISYPKDWSTYDEKQLNSPLIKAAFYDPKPEGKFASNLNVTVTPGASYTAKDIADNATKVLQENGEANGMKDYKAVDFTEVDHNGFKAALSTASYSNPQSSTDVMLTQLIVPAKENTYVVSYSTPKKDYDKDKDTLIKSIMDSFKVKE
ncbi:PsbP-related protein [Paenibacillus sp. J22TS3]|uniref:PsbP-related protein n=1 Tax=Paenibacillus sp. J22TS3 TaxID=2807192 RepID=UPI001B0C022D|nr:PsbP-related protein [Paenibacillus sp. J22TS3]GIP20023.1 hypothetical protein J22TS3_02980 [Paenibacillus sp. J22TS3]